MSVGRHLLRTVNRQEGEPDWKCSLDLVLLFFLPRSLKAFSAFPASSMARWEPSSSWDSPEHSQHVVRTFYQQIHPRIEWDVSQHREGESHVCQQRLCHHLHGMPWNGLPPWVISYNCQPTSRVSSNLRSFMSCGFRSEDYRKNGDKA